MTARRSSKDAQLDAGSLERLCTVCASEPKIDRAILYGSRAKGLARPGSDIDLTLDGNDLTLRDLNRIEGKVDDLLLPQRVDLSLRRHIENTELLKHIERVGIVVYESGIDLFQRARQAT